MEAFLEWLVRDSGGWGLSPGSARDTHRDYPDARDPSERGEGWGLNFVCK